MNFKESSLKLAIGCSSFLFVAGMSTPAISQVSVVYSTYQTQPSIGNRQYEAYLEELSQRTKGYIKIKEKFYGQALLKAEEHLKGVGQGLADVGYYCTGNHPAQLPLSSMAEIPYITSKGDAVSKAMAELYDTYPPLREEFHRANVEALAWDVSSPTIIGLKKQISSAKELAGLKVRAYGEVGNIARKGGGMIPVTMSAGDVLTSLQTGVLDGYTGVPLWLPLPFNWLTETKTIISPGIGTYYTCGLVMNLDKYKALPESAKTIIAEMRRAHSSKAVKLVMEADLAAIEASKKLGIKFYEFTPEEISTWKKTANFENVIEDWVKIRSAQTKANVREFVEKYIATVKKYEDDAVYKQNFPKN